MLSVAEALERVLEGVTALPAETVALGEAHERVLALPPENIFSTSRSADSR
jgi:molybdopterin biosynthesis enzyme